MSAGPPARNILNFAVSRHLRILLHVLLQPLVYLGSNRPYLTTTLYRSALVWLFHVQGHSHDVPGPAPCLGLAVLWVSVAYALWGAVLATPSWTVRKNLRTCFTS
jgi:hypothetical protein